jgi:hypothetical protein
MRPSIPPHVRRDLLGDRPRPAGILHPRRGLGIERRRRIAAQLVFVAVNLLLWVLIIRVACALYARTIHAS